MKKRKSQLNEKEKLNVLEELKEFRNIPVKVTLNEYIEISKSYSTKKSSKFINGVLDNILISSDEIRKK